MLRALEFLKRQVTRSMSTRAALPPLTVPRTCALEPAQLYRHGGYRRVHPGEVYNGEYEALQQLGWGRSSTVWLVKELTCVL